MCCFCGCFPNGFMVHAVRLFQRFFQDFPFQVMCCLARKNCVLSKWFNDMCGLDVFV